MKILITGGTGFIGRNIVIEALNKGYEVALLIRADSNLKYLPKDKNLKFFEYKSLKSGHLVNKIKSWEPACIYHVAWKGVTGAERNNLYQFTENIEFTIDSIILASKVGCKKWIGAGSQAEYGLKSGKISEQTFCDPVSAYGKAKLAAGIISLGMCEQLGIQGLWGRIFSTFGPQDNDKYLIPYIINQLLDGSAPNLTLCDQFWDFLYVQDAALAFLSLAEQNNFVGIYNIASGTALLLRDVVEKIRSLMSSDININYGKIPYSATQVMHLEGSIDKITRDTGWVPTTDLTVALTQTIEKYKKGRYEIN